MELHRVELKCSPVWTEFVRPCVSIERLEADSLRNWMLQHQRAREGVVWHHVDEHIAQWIGWQWHTSFDTAWGEYVVDTEYARAHPHCVSIAWLEQVCGTITAKLFDDGRLIAEHDAALASLRWRVTK